MAGITLLAATINGALGYGFSSITVPLALLFLSNRVLNPALVIIEVPLNAYVLWVNRAELPGVWRRVFPLIVGLVPGVVAGTLLVSRVSPDWLKFYTFVVLLPLILLQAAGVRRPLQAERSAGLIFGSGIGVLYSVTTISGPPLAIALNNQGFAKKEFRAALGVVRLAESSLTAIAYVYAGLFVRPSFALLPWIVPSVAAGVPLGAVLIRQMRAETFRRICMSFDAWVVGFGLSKVIRDVKLVDGNAAYLVLAGVIVIDALLLYRFFAAHGAPRNRRIGGVCRPRRRRTAEYGTLTMSVTLNSPIEHQTKAANATTTPDHLRALEAESIHIMREVVAEFERPVMLYSIGKDSSVLLRLAQKAFYPGPDSVSAAARRHDLQVPRDDRVPRPLHGGDRRAADRPHQQRGDRRRHAAVPGRHAALLRRC